MGIATSVASIFIQPRTSAIGVVRQCWKRVTQLPPGLGHLMQKRILMELQLEKRTTPVLQRAGTMSRQGILPRQTRKNRIRSGRVVVFSVVQ